MTHKKIDLSGVKVDDEVKSVLNDWGTVCVVGKKLINVKYPNGICGTYYYDGRCNEADLYPEIVEVRKEKWEPKEGDYIICTDGDLCRINPGLKETVAVEGRTYPTRELAKKAYSMIRPYQRLIAWILENDPDNDFEDGEYVVEYNYEDEDYFVVPLDNREGNYDIATPNISSKIVVEKLALELNEGIVKL